MIKIAVLGCCVSREMLNYTDKIQVKRCVYTPFVTLTEPMFPIETELIERVVPNDFYKKMVDLECRKNIFGYLKEESFDYLMLDFAETITDFYCVENGIRLPATEHYKAILDALNLPFEKQKYTNCDVAALVQKLFEELTSIIPTERIVLNSASYGECYLKEENGRIALEPFVGHYRLRPASLARVRAFEDEAVKYLENGIVLPPLRGCVSDGAHKYGLSPVHFTDIDYRFMAKRLEHALGAVTEKELYAAYERDRNEYTNLLFRTL